MRSPKFNDYELLIRLLKVRDLLHPHSDPTVTESRTSAHCNFRALTARLAHQIDRGEIDMRRASSLLADAARVSS